MFHMLHQYFGKMLQMVPPGPVRAARTDQPRPPDHDMRASTSARWAAVSVHMLAPAFALT